MFRSLCIIIILSCAVILQAQEVSRHIPMTEYSGDFGVNMKAIDDGYIILTVNWCHDSTFTSCIGLLKTDRQGNKIWSRTYSDTSNEKTGLHNDGYENMVIVHDTIYVIMNIIPPEGQEYLRLMAFDLEGEPLYSRDLHIPNEGETWARGMLASGDELILYGSSEDRIFIMELNRRFETLDEHWIGDPDHTKRNMDLIPRSDGGFTLSYVTGSIVKGNLYVVRFNHTFDTVFHKKILEKGSPLNPRLFEAEDGGYLLVWNEDLWNADTILHNVFFNPTTIFKLDSLARLQWEYYFIHPSSKEHINAVMTDEGDLFGMGATDYFDSPVFDSLEPPQWLNGWCFLIDQQGQLKWDRGIADLQDSSYLGSFWYGLDAGDGFVLTGDIDHWTKTGQPFLNDQNVWFLTLDENGCWNGNCDDFIIITGDTTSTTDNEPVPQYERDITAYPNPTTGEITIDCADCTGMQNRLVRIYDSNGKKVAEFKLHAPRSTINLSQLEEGIYFATYIIEGQRVKTQKVVVQR